MAETPKAEASKAKLSKEPALPKGAIKLPSGNVRTDA